MRLLAVLGPLLVALQAAQAAPTLSLARAPVRKPLFTELYRQSVYAVSRYVCGLETYDLEMSTGAPVADLTVFFQSVGQELRIVLARRGQWVSEVKVPYPEERWEVLPELERAASAAQSLLKSQESALTGQSGPEARKVARAGKGYEAFDVFSLIWAVNELAGAQRDRAPSADVLKRLSVDYAWLGLSVGGLPSGKAKLFAARSLAYSVLAGRLWGADPSETAFALALAGRDADALQLLAKPRQDSPELSLMAGTLARRDVVKARQRAVEAKSRDWKLIHALLARTGGGRLETVLAFRDLVAADPADLFSMHSLVAQEDAAAARALSERYLETLMVWDPFMDLVKGRLLAPDASFEARPKPPRGEEFVAALRAAADFNSIDQAQEIPLGARLEVAGDFGFDAALQRTQVLHRVLGAPDAAKDLLGALQAFIERHRWGFLIPAAAEADRAAAAAVAQALARGPLSAGLVRDITAYVPGSGAVGLQAGYQAKTSQFDDVSGDLAARMTIESPEWSHYEALRLREVSPFEPAAVLALASMEKDPGVVERALKRQGERPALLEAARRAEAEKRPRDRARYAALLDRVLAADPANGSAVQDKAARLAAEGKTEEAFETWRGYLRLDSESPQASRFVEEMAQASLALDRPEAARALALAASEGGSESSLLTLGSVYEQLGRFDLAEDVLRRAEDAFGRDRARYRGLLFMRLGDSRGTPMVASYAAWFTEHQSLPGSVLTPEEHARLLDAYLATGRWPEAFQLLKEVLIPRWYAGDCGPRLWMALAALNKGVPPEQALEALREGEGACRPYDSQLPVVELYTGKRSLEEAVAALDDDPEARSLSDYFIAQFLARNDQKDQAKEYLRAVLKQRRFWSPEYTMALKELGLVPAPSRRYWTWAKATARDVGRLPGNLMRLRTLRGL